MIKTFLKCPHTLLYFGMVFLFSCSGIFYVPTSIIYTTPKNFDMNFEEVYFPSDEGILLHGMHLKNFLKKDPISLILYFHGNAQNISSRIGRLKKLLELGHDVFLFDYRGYGQSTAVYPNQRGTYKDALAALNYAFALKEKIKAKKFVVLGSSLGGVISSRAVMDFPRKKEIDLLVLDSTFMSYRDIAFDKIWRVPFLRFVYPFVPLLVSDEYAPRYHLPKLDLPILFIHGTKDYVVPYKFGKKFFESVSTPQKWLWTIPGGRHVSVFSFDPAIDYQEKFSKFIISL